MLLTQLLIKLAALLKKGLLFFPAYLRFRMFHKPVQLLLQRSQVLIFKQNRSDPKRPETDQNTAFRRVARRVKNDLRIHRLPDSFNGGY